MDDSCAVCADALEWVAYGACGHRDVCSTCVVRLRFICGDRRCCICKTEAPVVFITKALGDYTRTISDFAILPSEPREGRAGSYWYHEDSQAFFDDVDHYKMIKAMCRLSCSVCDKLEEDAAAGTNDGSKRRQRFRNIDQLKGHLFHRHKLLMCSLCLEGRKVFICEQKLYTRAQLNQHISTGDSEVDGSESERGGFTGHPMCEFCRSPFYGDNELYSHMSTEHYTCHICQRQHPGQYEYYKNYDDLELLIVDSFSREHFLCEDEACLAKKFVVFQSESEMKRHNTLEHGGHMSRAQRNAALQAKYRARSSSWKGRTFQRDQYDNELSIAIQASLESSHSEAASHDPSSSSSTQLISDQGDANDIDPLVQPFESLIATDSEMPSRYLQALGHGSRSTRLEESSFPPLHMNTSNNQQTAQESEGLPNNTMAAHLRRQTRNATVLNSAQPWPAPRRGNASSSSVQYRPIVSPAPSVSRSPAGGSLLSGYASSIQSQAQVRPTLVQGHLSTGFLGNWGDRNRITHSASAPNLSDSGSSKPSISDFPPVSATQIRKVPPGNQVLPKVDDVQTANKSLVEKIQTALEYDEDKYATFKDISGQYRQGSIDTEKYLHYVREYGLSHLVLELARLCPDLHKQKELVDTYNASLRSNGPQENGWGRASDNLKDSTSIQKGKRIDGEGSSSRDRLADSILSTVRTLQSNYKSPEEEVELLLKDGYRATKGKSNVMVDERRVELRSQNDSTSAGNGSSENGRDGASGNKQRKKTSKFHRVRLGDGSMAALWDLKNSDPDPDPDPNPVGDQSDGSNNSSGGLPVRGVWRKGGGQKLFP